VAYDESSGPGPGNRFAGCLWSFRCMAVPLMIRSSLRHTSKRALSWRHCFVLALTLLGANSALAPDPDKHITQYAQVAWRMRPAVAESAS
jgi:hypothetical protein